MRIDYAKVTDLKFSLRFTDYDMKILSCENIVSGEKYDIIRSDAIPENIDQLKLFLERFLHKVR